MRKVSLYIPCYNGGENIKLCLEGALRQTYPVEEIIVIDDGSTDGTADIASGYPVRVIKHKNNLGLAAARNTALKNINTEFVASVDADCVPQPQWLELAMDNFISEKIAGVGGRLFEPACGSVADAWRGVHMKQEWGEEKYEPPFLYGSNSVFRRSALFEIKLYREEYRNNFEDCDISQRLKDGGYSLVYEPKAVVYHLRKDTISSALRAFWNWNFWSSKREGYYDSPERLSIKAAENVKLSARFMQEDHSGDRPSLFYSDFMLALHLTLLDYVFFYQFHFPQACDECDGIHLKQQLALTDLIFYYHFDSSKRKLGTMVPASAALRQNFFAVVLIVGGFINKEFKNERFANFVSGDLLSILERNIERRSSLLDIVSNVTASHHTWDDFGWKEQKNLCRPVLHNFLEQLQGAIGGLVKRNQDIVKVLEASQKALRVAI